MFVYPFRETLFFSDWLPMANNRIIFVSPSGETLMFSDWLSVAEDQRKHVGPVGTIGIYPS